ncbi:MAG: 6-carboxytetrahydropterin synthase QueD [Gemmatimonadetes bacterium]|uniref:6-carboxy-5,6,7,8-tetrahydropterin synthase n=1 Tax=Candidatus Kutchimonas denitrificans TaxID=3056748 RepID=A0AAE5CAP2_9BACT|nr:6-carboxytetrahydropterin synthase QueD [Gemmatimonadota bacterium]NIR74777.1 6-carboxytetrahydropterin synthase QueD [Candidatus Kutchimonas denitrificans]NIS01527.1 6-carboxytetrahydropterin synthase QueD [Gemmatimonadota bacterium]NIT67268.1 6-carboxytetrahydropterin synthase QueD [Gemmatimonadota bacterium]NIU52442.1 6-carboxytetrahydropterin synthase QueD [Gemmatimonadota bacterium]
MEVELNRKYNFAAAHHLPKAPEGHKCRRLHGHSYRVEVGVRGPVNPETGWLIDYGAIDTAVKPVIARLDHRTLNDVPGLENATSEHLCRWLWEKLEGALPQLHRVSVAETCAAACHYYGER